MARTDQPSGSIIQLYRALWHFAASARGILAARGSQLVLLEEPTARLDANTEARVHDNLFNHFADACLIAAVHRINLLNRFDEILFMQAGVLLAQGLFAQLPATSPEFQQLMAAYSSASN
jgi:ATP-binding cassette, subfamily B, bacterial